MELANQNTPTATQATKNAGNLTELLAEVWAFNPGCFGVVRIRNRICSESRTNDRFGGGTAPVSAWMKRELCSILKLFSNISDFEPHYSYNLIAVERDVNWKKSSDKNRPKRAV